MPRDELTAIATIARHFATVAGVWFRRRRVRVQAFDASLQRWCPVGTEVQDAQADQLTLTTFNVWFNEQHAADRYRAIARILRVHEPDLMVFQEVTEQALAVFGSQPWIRARYRSASVLRGTYGMLILSRLPLGPVTYTRLPTRLARGFLRADLLVDGVELSVCSVHLESGKESAGLRARQLQRICRSVHGRENVVLLGDFNMRDAENPVIGADYLDVWPQLRPDEPGYTEDTTINHMRFDTKSKHRHVRFDRVLVKGDRWRARDIELLGTEPISPVLPRIFPSDHFGVRCRLDRSR